MEHKYQHKQLPSGKTVIKHFGPDGSLLDEKHAYDLLSIGISYRFEKGKKVEETYFARRRMVNRKTYEKARISYTDMPPADTTQDDWGGGLLDLIAQEREKRAQAAKHHQPDPKEAQSCDALCSMVMQEGKRREAVKWVQTRSHTLGERTWAQSKRLVDRLKSLGCVHLYACQIDDYEDGDQNTGHLVVELPKNPPARQKILKAIDRLASETGYEGPFDNGQRYVYVKLD